MAGEAAKALAQFAEQLQGLEVSVAEDSAKALNAAAKVARKRGIDLILQDVNFDRSYVESGLVVRGKATAKNLRVSVAADFEPVTHRRFGAKYLRRPAISELSVLKGNPARGLSRGQAPAGLGNYSVFKGSTMNVPRGFIITGANGNTIPLLRIGPGRKLNKSNSKTLYAPTISQIWRGERQEVRQEVVGKLLEQIERALR